MSVNVRHSAVGCKHILALLHSGLQRLLKVEKLVSVPGRQPLSPNMSDKISRTIIMI